jgi:hypothetical protein
VPVWAEGGRCGGYCLDSGRTLPPVNFTPGEAMALAVALRHVAGTPFGQDGAAALRKILAVMRRQDADAARDLAARVYLVGDAAPASLPAPITDALTAGRVLRIGYADVGGAVTRRDVEPLGFVGLREHWYLLAWCRLRDAVRAFRTDRITAVSLTAQVPAPRPLRQEDIDIPLAMLRPLSLELSGALANRSLASGRRAEHLELPARRIDQVRECDPGRGRLRGAPDAAAGRLDAADRVGDVLDQHAEHRVPGQRAAGVEQAAGPQPRALAADIDHPVSGGIALVEPEVPAEDLTVELLRRCRVVGSDLEPGDRVGSSHVSLLSAAAGVSRCRQRCQGTATTPCRYFRSSSRSAARGGGAGLRGGRCRGGVLHQLLVRGERHGGQERDAGQQQRDQPGGQHRHWLVGQVVGEPGLRPGGCHDGCRQVVGLVRAGDRADDRLPSV